MVDADEVFAKLLEMIRRGDDEGASAFIGARSEGELAQAIEDGLVAYAKVTSTEKAIERARLLFEKLSRRVH